MKMEKNLISQIDEIAIKDPDKIAYNYLNDVNTYGDLKKYSDALADYIINLELPERAPIVVYGGQNFNMISAFLGVVKSGHPYIPVDIHSSISRLHAIDEIGKPALYISVEPLNKKIKFENQLTHTELIDIYSHGTLNNNLSAHFVDGEDIYYIIFTSGTTGKPKGVQISHDNLKSFVDWMHNDFNIIPNSVCLSQAPYSFDLSVMDLYPTLTNGGQLAVLPKEITDNFKDLFMILPKLKLNTWVSTPSFMDICLLDPNFNERNMPDLSVFLFCGEELTHATASSLKERFPNAHIFNTYGPTETTVAVTKIEITSDILRSYSRLPIGKAKSDTKILLFDKDKNSFKENKGEIIIIGPSVSKGYINNIEKTKESFININDERAYKTGDLGQIDDNGQLLYKGRLDFQIKLHGFRIELEDVDHHLKQVSLISQAITVPKYDKDGKVSQLIAYIVPKTNNYESNFELTQAIKNELKNIMMSYMMPQRFVYVDKLPMTSNGKVDRKYLMKEVNK